jgi:HAD superfamily hydrolase (TIGR01509 family)
MDAIIFDFDGVLVDSEPIHLLGFREVLRRQGIFIQEEDYYREYVGMDDEDCFRAAARRHGREVSPEQVQKWTADKTRIVQAAMRTKLTAMPGAADLVRQATAEALPIAICSGALRAELELAARTVGLRDAFPVIVSAEDVSAGKPDPEGYRLARAHLTRHVGRELLPERCWVIEDTPAGIAAGKAVGMRVLAVATTNPPAALRQADHIIFSLADITLEELRDK